MNIAHAYKLVLMFLVMLVEILGTHTHTHGFVGQTLQRCSKIKLFSYFI